MYSKTTLVINPSGFHARPASELIRAASRFKSEIIIGPTCSAVRVSAKSIIMVLGLGITQGSEVELSAEGVDEREAVDTLVKLIQSGLGELL